MELAMEYTSKLVAQSPASCELLIDLGDIYFSVHQKGDALIFFLEQRVKQSAMM